MKIVAGLLGQVGAMQRADVLGLHMGYAVVTLERALDDTHTHTLASGAPVAYPTCRPPARFRRGGRRSVKS